MDVTQHSVVWHSNERLLLEREIKILKYISNTEKQLCLSNDFPLLLPQTEHVKILTEPIRHENWGKREVVPNCCLLCFCYRSVSKIWNSLSTFVLECLGWKLWKYLWKLNTFVWRKSLIPLDFPAFKKVRVNNSLILTAASHFLSPVNFLTRAFAVSNVSVMRKNVKGRRHCAQKYRNYGFWDDLSGSKKYAWGSLIRYVIDNRSAAWCTLDRH